MTNIDDLDFSKTYTYADYYSWRFEERLELIKGKIFKMSPAPGGNHQTIVFNLAGKLQRYLKGKFQQAFAAPFNVRLMKVENNDIEVNSIVQPDLCVVCDVEKIVDGRTCLGAPDIMVEVLSSGNNKKDLHTKFDLYEDFGVREYWIVYPSGPSLIRYVLGEDGKFKIEGRALTIGDNIITPVLPGFELALEDIFRDLLEE